MTLTDGEREELQRRRHSRKGRADDARRARSILLLAEGASWAQIRGQLRCGDSYINRWSRRFTAERLAGLYSRHRGQSATILTAKLEAKILDWTRRAPQDGFGRAMLDARVAGTTDLDVLAELAKVACVSSCRCCGRVWSDTSDGTMCGWSVNCSRIWITWKRPSTGSVSRSQSTCALSHRG